MPSHQFRLFLSPDVNGDGKVDGTDMRLILSGWSGTGACSLPGTRLYNCDIFQDSVVNALDAALAIINWTNTSASPTPQPSPVGGIQPYPGAPLCPDSGTGHDNSLFHALWDSTRGCHYDHEHGTNPFTPDVAATFPGFNLYSLLGNVGVG